MDKAVKEFNELKALGGAITDEQLARLDELAGQLERERKRLDLVRRAEDAEASLTASRGRRVPDIEVGGTPAGGEKKNPLYRSLGDFVESVFRRDARLEQHVREYAPVKSSDDGVSFLIPAELSQEVMAFSPLDEVVAPRCKPIPPGAQPDSPFQMPVMVQEEGFFDGVSFAWTEEGETSNPADNPKQKVLTLKPHEVIGTWQVSQKVLRNASQYSDWITRTFQSAFSAMRDHYLLLGTGTTQPIGLLNSDCKVMVTRNTAGVIKLADVLALRQVIPPSMRRDAVWVAASDALASIEGMTDAANRLLYGPGDVSQQRPETLCGLPLFYTDHAALGEANDLALVVPRTYLWKQGFGPALAVSEHVKFLEGLACFRLVASFDGVCWAQSPLTLANGHVVSPVAALTGT